MGKRSLRLVLLGAALLAVSLDVTRAQASVADSDAIAVAEPPVQEEVAPTPPVVSEVEEGERIGAPEGSSLLTKGLYSIYTPPKKVATESDGTPFPVTMQYPPEIYFYAFVYFAFGLTIIVGPFAYSAGKPQAYRPANRSRP
jgi:hypothetical protein